MSSRTTNTQLKEDLAAKDAQIADLNNQLTEMAFHAHEVEDDLKTRYEEDLVQAELMAELRDQQEDLVGLIDDQEFVLGHALLQQEELVERIALLYSMIAWTHMTVGSASLYAGDDPTVVSTQLDTVCSETADVAAAFIEAGDDFSNSLIESLNAEGEEAFEAHCEVVADPGVPEFVVLPGEGDLDDEVAKVARQALDWLYDKAEDKLDATVATAIDQLDPIEQDPVACEDPDCSCQAAFNALDTVQALSRQAIPVE